MIRVIDKNEQVDLTKELSFPKVVLIGALRNRLNKYYNCPQPARWALQVFSTKAQLNAQQIKV